MPTKVAEYMARGVPVITTPLPLAVDLVERHECGYVVPFGPATAGEAAEAVLALQRDPSVRDAMGARGHQGASQYLRWPADARAFVAQLEQWAGGSVPRVLRGLRVLRGPGSCRGWASGAARPPRRFAGFRPGSPIGSRCAERGAGRLVAGPVPGVPGACPGRRLRALALDNKLFTLVLAAGAVLRLITVLGYPGALWFAGDSYVYLGAALRLRPDLSKSTGYSLFLKVLEPFHSLTLITILQHLMGLAIAVMLYVLLRRARVPKLWSALATVPVLLNGFQIELEHMIMADTLFMFLLVLSATILLWRRRPSWPAVLMAGLLTGYAVTVWSGGLILPVVFIVFVIWRRMGWRPLAAIVAGSAVPIAGYAVWFHSSSGTSRSPSPKASTCTAGCRRSPSAQDQPAGQRAVSSACRYPSPSACPRAPCLAHSEGQGGARRPGQRGRQRNAARLRDPGHGGPAGQLRARHRERLVLSVDWKRYNYPSRGTVYDYYFHTQPQTVPVPLLDPGGTAPQDIQAYGHQSISRVVSPFAYLMSGYERVFYLYGPLFGLILLLGLGRSSG